jgi:uncharacterized protein (TIGR00255 family)
MLLSQLLDVRELMQSMTGFGQASGSYGDYHLQVELKSVNHRFLELNLRLSKERMGLEEVLKQKLKSALQRGKVDAFVSIERSTAPEANLILNWPLAEAYYNAAQQLKSRFSLSDALVIQDLLHIPELFKQQHSLTDADPILQEQVIKCMDEALRELISMRNAEGSHLHTDLITRLQALHVLLQSMRKTAPQVIEQYRQKLRIRVQDLLDGLPYDEYRMLQEVLLYADRTNVDEELTRLESHFNQFSQLLDADEPVGRKLDFLLQEINREVNTIGSKANDNDLINDVVEMKAEIEKLREQVQNIQ